ncbi:DUF2255 family protein [Actinoplanes sp. TBRC 11911]|uniref:DUF2255 family protein n=1 Tax=Actinoplanes sp. TBRC 11911 TaxID=2729386 RepID=UPI00145CE2B7|nr:DUF2255 family protein [Actinoplanes sp. TBRC 11911]NMO55094.1 DUF2255 family protein [Actinoplanes sp. TBRC 11911]
MTMSWTGDELTKIGDADELEVSSVRPDGSLRPYVTIWVVRLGDDLYIRSAYGPENGWYRRAHAAGAGRVRAGGVTHDVTFEDGDPALRERIDDAYHAKYDKYGPTVVGPMVGEELAAVTFRLSPR